MQVFKFFKPTETFHVGSFAGFITKPITTDDLGTVKSDTGARQIPCPLPDCKGKCIDFSSKAFDALGIDVLKLATSAFELDQVTTCSNHHN
jgi:hypothetical protein